MIRHLLKKYSNINIILRPHSYENKDAWQKLIGDYKNLKIINKDGISKWIRNAKIIIHNGCTSGLEASFSKKNVIAYVPYENKLIRNIPNECSTIVKDLASLDKEVENAYYNNKIPTNNNSEKILSNRFKNYNNELAVLKILKIIENNSDNSLSKKNNLFLINIFSNLINLKIYIRNLFRFNKIDTNSLKFMKFNNSNIKQTIDGFYKIFQNMKKINIKKISSRVIFIELEK